MNLQPVVLSGGTGSRLWPLSREHYPKQLLALTDELSLFQQTLARLTDVKSPDDEEMSGVEILPSLVICNEVHRFLIAEQARQAGYELSGIILEPVGRNTAPALTLAAMHAIKCNDDVVMMVMPADHVIADMPRFHESVRLGYQQAQSGRLVTFGIVPDHPETGYGYIKTGSVVVELAQTVCSTLAEFVEKPDLATAEGYVASGQYLWNSGMFMMRASVWLKAIKTFQPEMFEQCQKAFDNGIQDMDFYRIDKDAFSACPDDSIDYAVMEKITGSDDAVVISLDAGWSDIGAWPALAEISDTDEHGNVKRGDVLIHDTHNSMLVADSRMIATVGIKDLIVIETADAVLVADKKQAQEVKKIVEQLKAKNRSEHLTHRLVYRPWGSYEGIDLGERFQVKRITVNPGSSLSLQMHHHRAEHWIVVSGTAEVTCGEKVFLLTENQSTYIPIGEKHRLVNPGTVPLELIEVQSGSYLGEDDIVRFEDEYGRSGE